MYGLQAIVEGWSGQNIEEGQANAAWLQAAQARAATFVGAVRSGGGGAAGAEAALQSRLSAASAFEASATLDQVSAGSEGLLQRLSEGPNDNDASATAAAKKGQAPSMAVGFRALGLSYRHGFRAEPLAWLYGLAQSTVLGRSHQHTPGNLMYHAPAPGMDCSNIHRRFCLSA